jgi:hypothetical protein
MPQSGPLLTSSATILWLKVILTAVSLVLLYFRYRSRSAPGASSSSCSFRTKVILVFAVLFSFAVFHDLGKPRSGTFVHYGEMFHYYLGAKYFDELGYFELYNAVIVADAEQDSALATLPFYTDLNDYKNASRETALAHGGGVKERFSQQRWSAFRRDVSFFKRATGTPRSPAFSYLLMDHGYNASPVSTSVLGILTNIVPVTELGLLASLDVFLVAAMVLVVFFTFGFEMGALFSVYFFVNILNDHSYISGGLLRYDWLFCIVAAVCLLEKKRHASAAFFLTVAAMMKVFPAVLFYGIGVAMVRKAKTARTVDRESRRFMLAAGVTSLALFLLPAVYFGSALQPWQDFSAKTALHDRGVYVNHLGLRGMALFERSQLSLDGFVEAYQSGSNGDIVRHWQDVKEEEFQQKKPVLAFCSALVLICLTALIWRKEEREAEGALWSLLLVYTMSYPSHYYYTFMCLFVLLFFKRANSLDSFVPLCLLLVLNIAALVTDASSPSPIAFYTLVNMYLFLCLTAVLGFELYRNFSGTRPELALVPSVTTPTPAKRRKHKAR